MSDIYAYEVTSSALEGVKVGTFVIDEDHTGDQVRSYPMWNAKTGDFERGFTAERRERACGPCWRLAASFDPADRLVRPHGHEGEHGPGEPLRPTRQAAEVTR
jgi:hypothetical protein